MQYAIEIVGPTTNALIPVDVTMLAHADALSLPFIDGFANSIVGFASAGVLLGYANGLATAPSLPDVEAATRYDYKTAREDPPVLDAQTERFNGVVMMAANEVINVSVVADVQLTYSSMLGISETASGSASADPTFAIDDPAFANYTIVGVPAGPAATAAPEPATWAMMLLGFAGLGFAGYRKAKRNGLLAA